MAIKGICSIENCGKPSSSKGLCGKHYQMLRRHGDPLHVDPGGRTGRRLPTREGYRTCKTCGKEHPATDEFFGRNRRMSLGLAHRCKPCMLAHHRSVDRSRHKWATFTQEKKDRHHELSKKYRRSARGRAHTLRKAYARVDACDLSVEEVLDLISLPCVYCGTTAENRGLDRIDNALPHIRGNVQPACTACNIARGDRFTVAEMMLIGRAIAEVRASRPPDYKYKLFGSWGPAAREPDDGAR